MTLTFDRQYRFPLPPAIRGGCLIGINRSFACRATRYRASTGYLALPPRDFDISPYFQVVKPGLADNFNYRLMDWIDLPRVAVSDLREGRAEHHHRSVRTQSMQA
jgi:hypothetical protein